jgi:hypothetical protein
MSTPKGLDYLIHRHRESHGPIEHDDLAAFRNGHPYNLGAPLRRAVRWLEHDDMRRIESDGIAELVCKESEHLIDSGKGKAAR